MEINHSTVSSLTFNIQSGSQIQGIIYLIQQEAHKEGCMEPEVTLVSTAISEICRKFMEHSDSLELTLALHSLPQNVKLQGKATTRLVSDDIPWKQIMTNLNTCFTETNFREDNDSSLLTYSFHKTIPCK